MSVLAALLIAAPLHAQIDPRQMAGIPRPVDDLPSGSVSVRVIRGSMTNNIADQTVELHVGAEVQTVKTDSEGRAQFDRLPAGAALKAVAVVDGERLESLTFPAPAQGGIRLLLVATGGAASADAGPPAVTGDVSIGESSRIIVQPGEETIVVYYLLEIRNPNPAPVNPATPFTFEMPTGASRTVIIQGSSPLASVNGPRVQVSGPFPPGQTLLNIGAEITVTSGAYELVQRFPAALTQFAVIVKKIGDTKLSSPQFAELREVPAEGESFMVILGAGGPIAAGQPLTFSLTGLPHHSAIPKRVTILLALGIVVVGVLAGWRPRDDASTRGIDRKKLVARREKLLGDLVRLERDQRHDQRDPRRYTARREEILAALEPIYSALDSDGTPPGPGHTAGVAA